MIELIHLRKIIIFYSIKILNMLLLIIQLINLYRRLFKKIRKINVKLIRNKYKIIDKHNRI